MSKKVAKVQMIEFKASMPFQYGGDLYHLPGGKHPVKEAFRDRDDPSKPHPMSEDICKLALSKFGDVRTDGGGRTSYARTWVEYVEEPVAVEQPAEVPAAVAEAANPVRTLASDPVEGAWQESERQVLEGPEPFPPKGPVEVNEG